MSWQGIRTRERWIRATGRRCARSATTTRCPSRASCRASSTARSSATARTRSSIRPTAHWFVGDGMLHAFTLDNGKASYRNRWVRTPKFLAEHDAGRAIWSGKGFGGQKLPDAPPTVGHGRRRRQHQRHLARRQAAGARGGAPADRDRSQDARHQGLCRLRAAHRRAGHRPSQDRSRHRRADLLRLQRHRAVLDGHDLRRDRSLRRRQRASSGSRRPTPAWCTTSSSPRTTCCSRSCR